MRTRVLVCGEDTAVRGHLTDVLAGRGMDVIAVDDGADAMKTLDRERLDVALVDLTMSTVDGQELLEHIQSKNRGVEVIVMAPPGDLEAAANAVRAGAYHFLTQPLRSDEEVAVTVSKAAERRQLLGRSAQLQQRLQERDEPGELLGSSGVMREVRRRTMNAASLSSPVLLVGESGTGKELTARAIHDHSRRGGPFVAVDCAAIPADRAQSELFGHAGARGPATTAAGLFEAARGGTLFIDEVGDLPLGAQTALAGALQPGSSGPSDVRVIAASRVDLSARVAAGRFREELFELLSGITLELPPLRMRRDDIPLLAQHFVRKHATKMGCDVRRIAPEAVEALGDQPWPGNVRELDNAVERAVVLCQDETITPAELRLDNGQRSREEGAQADSSGGMTLSPDLAALPYREAKQRLLAAFDGSYFSAVLERTGGNVSEAARQSGLDRSNFRRAAKRAGVTTRR